MMHALRAREKLEGSFDVDAERAYVNGVRAWFQGGEVAESGTSSVLIVASIILADCHVARV